MPAITLILAICLPLFLLCGHVEARNPVDKYVNDFAQHTVAQQDPSPRGPLLPCTPRPHSNASLDDDNSLHHSWGSCCYNGGGRPRGEVPIKGPDTGQFIPVELPNNCQCSDAAPRWYSNGEIAATCLEAKARGQCWDPFMFGGDADLIAEHFCEITCGRCNCCKDLYETIKQYGGDKFLELVDRDGEMSSFLKEVGNAATVLVPTNEAMRGVSVDNVKDVIQYHVLPQNAVNALWTTPFMSLGVEMQTMNNNAGPLRTEPFDLPANTTWEGGLTGFQIQGKNNAVNVVRSDISSACKGYITFVDGVLLP